MCARCLGQDKDIESVQSKDELWVLYSAAYEQYQSEVLTGEKKYSRFVNDFISYHLPFFCKNQEAIRLHSRNLAIIHELLMERQDLVVSFFGKETFAEEDYLQMHKLFNTTNHISDVQARLASFSAEQINLITDFVNEVNLFSVHVTEADMEGLFGCALKLPLKTTCNRRMAIFFDALRTEGLLPFAWQKIIGDNCLVASSQTEKPLTAKQIGTSLTQAKRLDNGDKSMYYELAKHLKKMKEK